MKYVFMPAIAIAALCAAGTVSAQSAKGKPGTQATVTTAPAGSINPREIEGKWKIDRMLVEIKAADGEAIQNNVPTADEDFFEFQRGMLTANINGTSDSSPYTISGNYVITKEEEGSDSIKIVSLSKTSCVLVRKEESADGVGKITITLKR